MDKLIYVIQHTLFITALVWTMLLIIDYFSLISSKYQRLNIENKAWKQIVFAALLGILPGCLGTYTVVTLYSKRLFGFAALVTAMIATSGDEAFIMFATIPETAIKITVLLFVIAILFGFLLIPFSQKTESLLDYKNVDMDNLPNNKIKIPIYSTELLEKPIKKIGSVSVKRGILMLGALFFLGFLIFNFVHNTHTHDSMHSHNNEEGFFKYIFVFLALINVFIVWRLPEHYIQTQVWNYTLKEQLSQIFLWTFGTFLFISLMQTYIFPGEESMKVLASEYKLIILLVAIGVGVIPESGPHIVFISLFSGGVIPLSVLLANSIVQDGHGAIPLLGTSVKSFIFMKIVNIAAGLLVGLLGLAWGW